MSKDTNNFWCYMPGGMYRKPDVSPEKRKLMEAIDQHLAATGFDVLSYMGILEQSKAQFVKYRDLVKTGTDAEIEEAGREAQRLSDLEYELHKPVFDAMLAKGFARLLLVQ